METIELNFQTFNWIFEWITDHTQSPNTILFFYQIFDWIYNLKVRRNRDERYDWAGVSCCYDYCENPICSWGKEVGIRSLEILLLAKLVLWVILWECIENWCEDSFFFFSHKLIFTYIRLSSAQLKIVMSKWNSQKKCHHIRSKVSNNCHFCENRP